MWEESLDQTKTAKHRIDLISPHNKPIDSAAYQAGRQAREFEKHEINNMFPMDGIDPSQMILVYPIVCAPEKDITPWFCEGVCKLSAVTIQYLYPIPCMDECMNSLGDAMISFTLDTNSSFWKMDAAKVLLHKMALPSHYGLLKFTQMLFWSKECPRDVAMRDGYYITLGKWQSALVYFDGIVKFLNSSNEHIVHVRPHLKLLNDAA